MWPFNKKKKETAVEKPKKYRLTPCSFGYNLHSYNEETKSYDFCTLVKTIEEANEFIAHLERDAIYTDGVLTK